MQAIAYPSILQFLRPKVIPLWQLQSFTAQPQRLETTLHDLDGSLYAIFSHVNPSFQPLFASTQLEDQRLTPAALSSLIQVCQREYQTGLIEFFPHEQGPSHLLLFARGQVVSAYLRASPSLRLSADAWPRALQNAPAWLIAHSLTLTPQALRLLKILVEAPPQETPRPLKTLHLEAALTEAGLSPTPGLVHLLWPSAEGLVLLPGGGRPPRQSLFLSAGQIVHSAGGLQVLSGWREPECFFTVYPWRQNCPAWEEYLLHRAFVRLSEHLLQRFAQTRGGPDLNLLLQQVNRNALAQGWPLRLAASGVTDQLIACSPQQAADTYARTWQNLFEQIQSVVGEPALRVLRREGLSRLTAETHQVLRKYHLP